MRRLISAIAIAILALVVTSGRAEATPKKKKSSRSAASCYKALDRLGVKYSKAKRRHIKLAVRVSGPIGGVSYSGYNKKPLVLDCSLVVSLAAAGPLLAAHGIEMAKYSSAYQVRRIRGSNRRSNHSYGLAIDVHSYHGDALPTGLVIKDDYEQGLGDDVDCIGRPLTQNGAMLRALNCQFRRSGWFRSILDPDYDANHYNHFHIEVSPWAEREDDPLQRLADLAPTRG
ncbi:MAG TPA: extensin family protein [Kofleriaceae bacterium]|nr:extensin family protein [Kofleriaceae bacterium]